MKLSDQAKSRIKKLSAKELAEKILITDDQFDYIKQTHHNNNKSICTLKADIIAGFTVKELNNLLSN